MDDNVIYIPYITTEIFCIFYSLAIIVKANKNVGTDLQMRHFRGMALFFIVYLISDSIWALGQGGMIPFSVMMNKITSAAGLVAVSLLMLGWCIFVIYRIGRGDVKSSRLLIGLHYVVTSLDIFLVISSIFTGYLFYIDENEIYQTGEGFTLHLVLAFIQLFGSGVYSFAQRFSNKQARLRSEYHLPLFFIILPAAAAVLEGILPLCPIVPLGIFLAIHLAFLEIQNNEIYSDALTGLNNRRSMEIFLQDIIHEASDQKPFRLYMIDVNDFKQVNDKFGHLAGDKALQITANAIHNVSDSQQGFCARYGGDEFVLITYKDTPIQEAIQEEVNILRNLCSDIVPQITVCSGYTECRTSGVTAEQLIAQADEELYVSKKKYHGKKDSAEHKTKG